MRFVLMLLGAATAWAVGAGTSLAAATPNWPESDVPFDHGPGYYLSLWKMAPVWLLFATWVYTTDWVNRDTLALRLELRILEFARHVYVLRRVPPGLAGTVVLAVVSAADLRLCRAAGAVRPRAEQQGRRCPNRCSPGVIYGNGFRRNWSCCV